MDKAARISPLALCLVKPPAPELLHSMPVRDQRQLLADWAEATNLASTLTPLFTSAKKTSKPATRDEGMFSFILLCLHRPTMLDFVANRFMMKLFNTTNMQIIEFCCEQFNFILPSRQIANRHE